MITRKILNLGWPKNLICALGLEDDITLPLSDAQEVEIDSAINELARPEWREAIYQSFKEQLSFKKIGENYNISASGAHRMMDDAVYHLKNPLFAHRITTGAHFDNEHSLEALSLSAGAYNPLRRHGIYSIELLKETTAFELYSIRKFGKNKFVEIADALRAYDGSEIPDPENVSAEILKMKDDDTERQTETERQADVAKKECDAAKTQTTATIIKAEPNEDMSELLRTLDAMNKVIDGLFVLSFLGNASSIGISVYKEVEKAFDDEYVNTSSYLWVLCKSFKKIRLDTFADKIDYDAICQQAKTYLT